MRLLALAILLAPIVPAQSFQGQIKPRPLVPPLSQPWTQRQAVPPAIPAKPAARSGPCSIPTLTVVPRKVDSKMLVPTPEAGTRMPLAALPAPPCGETSRR
jgi:hypothetical protein